MKSIRIKLTGLAFALIGGTTFAAAPTAVNWDWTANPTQGTSVLNALDWFATANWTGDEPANSGLVKADFTTGCPSATRYVKADKGVTVADVASARTGMFTTNSAQKLVFVSDSPFLLNRDDSITSIPEATGVMFYSDVSWFKLFYPKSLIFCGDVAREEGANTSLLFAQGHPIEFRYDLYAKAPDPIRSQASGITRMTLNAGDLTMVAPHGSPVPVEGIWSLTENSPYIVRMGAAHVLCAGTIVTGEGLPAGKTVFVKRIFPDGIVELSEPATKTLSSATLTFAAFSPKVTEEFSVYTSASPTFNLRFMKWREEDEFRVTLTSMETPVGSTLVFGVKESAVPATTVIRNAVNQKGKLLFADCHMEMGVVGAAYDPSFSNCADARIDSAAAVSRFTVSNGLSVATVRIAKFSKLAGRLVKDGLGALELELTGEQGNYTGVAEVKAGTLSFDGQAELYVKTLAVSNGATLKVPLCGIRCENFVVQPGAIVSGPGSVTVTSFTPEVLDVVCVEEAKVLYEDTVRHGEIFVEPPATNVPGNPAAWFDASRIDTLHYCEDESGTLRVAQWDDVRGEACFSAAVTGSQKKPELHKGIDDAHNFVYFQQENGVTGSSTYELTWNRKISGIRSVFKVIGCRKGGGQFLGASPLWRAAENRSCSDPVIYSTLTTAFPPETTLFYVNGARRSWLDGYAYPGSVDAYDADSRVPQVAEMHLDADHATFAQGFAAQESAGRNGNQDLYELIVYTNELTEVERLEVTGYLMRKWLNAQVDYETAVDVARVPEMRAGQSVGLATGTKMAVETVSGTGVITKDGDGLLYVADCHSSSVSLSVKDGCVAIRSIPNDATALPTGAVLHLDAADESTYLGTYVSGSDTYLTEWGDVRGSGSVVARTPTTQNKYHPLVVSDVQNHLPMVDFRDFGYSHKETIMTGGTMKVRSVFTVQNSAKGGGFLFGDTAASCHLAHADGWHGIVRNPVGTIGYPIIGYGSATLLCSGQGATRTRLNGTDVPGQTTCFSGGTDLVSVRTFEGLVGNSISGGDVGANYCGGKMIGELIYFEDRLTDEETCRVEAYLNKKWFGTETPLYRPANLAAVAVGKDAIVSVVGGAPLVISSCAGEGTVQGALRFAKDSSWNVTVGADGVSSALTVTGTFDVAAIEKVVLSGIGKAEVGSYVLATTGGVIGDVSSIVIDSSAANGKRRYSLRQDGNDVVLDVQPLGLLMIVK